jgi:hypothetical protein
VVNKDPNATRKAREGSVPLLGGNGNPMPINLNIQLSGDGARPAAPILNHSTDSNPVVSNQAGGLSAANANATERQSAQRNIRRMKNKFPTISDFLASLDSDPDNVATPRHVQRYMELLTSPEHLGYGRIHELVITIQNSSKPGADWLKEKIEGAAKDTGATIHINEGTASFIYEEMLDAFEDILSQNAAI